ncbi:TSUP family transporter [Rhabdothermincola sediminis]|uniref:TSUP family transporter n=1 Tax=Rhabdothermincola sediminis TaxID=2751370 RepID=UPI001AA050C0|nr:TSUP family transporter [Rhabdothermincola sediminis]
MSPFTLLAAVSVMAAGAAVQGSVGFGAALVAAPLLALLDPTFVPAPLILAALVLNILMLRRERGSHHWRAVAWPIAGQIPGALMGATVLVLASDDGALGVIFAAMILAAVALSISGLRAEPTPPVLFAAGSLSGLMQSTVGAGGPPIALAFQGRSGPDLRAALARYFTVSCLVSLGFLAAVGQIGGRELVDAAVLMPGAVTGFIGSGWVSRHVDGVVARRAVLTLSALAALAVLARSLA